MASRTFYNTPGAVEEFLAWSGGLEEGERGEPPSVDRPASIQFVGTEEVMKTLGEIIAAMPGVVESELEGYAEKILAESRKEVPWDTTHLLQTGTVEWAADMPDTLQIGFNTPYAARQHEDLTLYHPKPGTKAKYLEDPAMRIAPEIVPGIVNYLETIMAGGVPSMVGMARSTRLSLGNLGGRFI